MTSRAFLSFTAFAVVVTLVPGPDFAVVLRGALVGGRARGMWTAAGVTTALGAVPLALVHAVVSAAFLVLVTLAAHRARRVLLRPRARRWLDGLTGTAMLGFGVRLAAEHA